MKTKIILLLLICVRLQVNAQETFPVNGVATEFEPIYAFINAHIIDADNEIPNGVLLIQGNKILQADTGVQIPKDAIITDLKGDFIYPLLLTSIPDMACQKLKVESILPIRNTTVRMKVHSIGIRPFILK